MMSLCETYLLCLNELGEVPDMFIQLLSQTPNLLENPGRYGGLLYWYNFLQSQWVTSSSSEELVNGWSMEKEERASLSSEVTLENDCVK